MRLEYSAACRIEGAICHGHTMDRGMLTSQGHRFGRGSLCGVCAVRCMCMYRRRVREHGEHSRPCRLRLSTCWLLGPARQRASQPHAWPAAQPTPAAGVRRDGSYTLCGTHFVRHCGAILCRARRCVSMSPDADPVDRWSGLRRRRSTVHGVGDSALRAKNSQDPITRAGT